MLQVGVHHAQQISWALAPAVEHGSCQAPLAGTREQLDARIALSPLIHFFRGAVGAAIVYDGDLVFTTGRLQRGRRAAEKSIDISCFVEGRYNQRKFLCRKPGRHPRTSLSVTHCLGWAGKTSRW